MPYKVDPAFGYPDISYLFHECKTGEHFYRAVLQSSWQICTGNKGRICIISADPNEDYEIFALARIVEGAKTIDIRRKLKGIDLPTIDEAKADIKAYWDAIEKEGGERRKGVKLDLNVYALRTPSKLSDFKDDLPF